jgi:rubrerythrin
LNDPDELVLVYKAENVTEAHLVRNLLADEDIDAVVDAENAPLTLPITPASVQVRRADEGRAREIIERYDAEQERRADRPDWTCPSCRATVVGAFDECDACGATRPGSEEIEEDEPTDE